MESKKAQDDITQQQERAIAERLDHVLTRLEFASTVIDSNTDAVITINNKDVSEAVAETIRLMDPAIAYLRNYQLMRNSKRCHCPLCGWLVRAQPGEPRSSCGCNVLEDIRKMREARAEADRKRTWMSISLLAFAMAMLIIQLSGCAAHREAEFWQSVERDRLDRMDDPDRCPIESPLVDPAYRAGFRGDRTVDPQVQLSEAYRLGAYYRTNDLLWRDGWRALEAQRAWAKEQQRTELVRAQQLERIKQ